jgi:hypothetical protein
MERLKELVPVLKRFGRGGSIEADGVTHGRIKLNLNHDQQTESLFNHFFRTNILRIFLMLLRSKTARVGIDHQVKWISTC